MAWFDFLFAESEKKAVLDWLVEHDTGDYHGFPMTYGYKYNRLYYENTYSLDALKQMKEGMIAKHERYLHEKAHPKPKVGETYKVFICGQHVDTLPHGTDAPANEKGAFVTIANEGGSTTRKEFGRTGNTNWTRA